MPRIVGKLRREGCQRPSGYWSCGAAMPQRGCASANRVSSATAPGVTSMSEFEAITNGALVAATPRLMFAPKPSVRSLAITSASRVEGEPPGFTVSDQLVHLRRERVQARAGIRVAGRPDHDRGDAHSSSR